MHRYLVLLITILTLSGCYESSYRPIDPSDIHYTHIQPKIGSPRRIIPVLIDKNFSDNDKVSIDNAINAWNYVLNGYLVMNVENYDFDMEANSLADILKRNGLVILKVDHTSKLIPDKGEYLTLAWADRIGGNKVWMIRDRFEQEDTYPIMLHELGHIFGANHEKDIPENKRFLMYPHYKRYAYHCVDGRAMEKVAMYQFINPNYLNYCY